MVWREEVPGHGDRRPVRSGVQRTRAIKFFALLRREYNRACMGLHADTYFGLWNGQPDDVIQLEHDRCAHVERDRRGSVLRPKLQTDKADRLSLVPRTLHLHLRSAAGAMREIARDNTVRLARHHYAAAVHPQRSATQLRNRGHLMAHENDGSSFASDVTHLRQAALLELRVADGEHLIDDQDVRLEVRGNREREAEIHAAGISLHRRINKTCDAGEFDDLVETALDVAPVHAKDGAVQEDVFAPRQLGMKARPDFEQCAEAAVHGRFTGRRQRDAGKHLEQRALAGAVAADDAERLSMRNVERDVAQRPERLRVVLGCLGLGAKATKISPRSQRGLRHEIAQRVVTLRRCAHAIALAEAFRSNSDCAHASTITRCPRNGARCAGNTSSRRGRSPARCRGKAI